MQLNLSQRGNLPDRFETADLKRATQSIGIQQNFGNLLNCK